MIVPTSTHYHNMMQATDDMVDADKICQPLH